MVPDGLVLLTSLAFIVGVVALARRKALAKELASVELLARVDTLCLDKTGTITTGDISLGGIEVLADHHEAFVRSALGAVGAADPKPNATLAAIVAAYPPTDGWAATDVVPFSSARKWAAAEFDGHGTFYLGAPDILLATDDLATRSRVAEHADEGRRVLLLARVDGGLEGDTLPSHRVPVALVLLEDTIKPDAPEILAFFRDQGVDLKVISGDHPSTVAAVARRAGVPGADRGFDARELPDDIDELGELLETTAVFGRVTPHQKRAMVAAMQRRGRVVAMTGDGVNDVLALKDSDMGIAMGSGSSATRAVAQLVLLDNRFSTLPRVLAEGRK
ncbi:MAG: HAD-IC family P-type ATPase, partial [Acidimicrobiales bacterium]|nr:HAD-IC family P-type ATPase [Acidimicrobiales bacterium]